MKSRFVEIPTRRFDALLAEIGSSIFAVGGSYEWDTRGVERIVTFYPPSIGSGPGSAFVRVFTTMSLADDTGYARTCGSDAIRIIVGFDVHGGRRGYYDLCKPIKILRTAPHGVEDRVGVFLDRLRSAIRDAYKAARAPERCSTCGKPMAYRTSRNGPFYGCTGFPQCRTTREI